MQPLLNLNTANIRPPVMVIFALLVLHSAALVGSMPERPENITVMFLSPTSVKITWSTASDDVEQYDVEYRPKLDRSYPFLSIVTCTRGSVTLDKLRPSTGYELTVTSVGKGRRTRSKTVTFRTLDENPRSERHQSNEKFQVRGVEVGIVILVLLVWIAAIVLFFNRWGKIRMLLPYQPDYKEQLKVTSTCGPNHQAGQACPQDGEMCEECWDRREAENQAAE